MNALLLAQGNGLYRCGTCHKVSNALQNLFDSYPDENSSPPKPESASRQPPVLGADPATEPAQEQEVTEEEAELLRAAGFQDIQEPIRPERNPWPIAAIVLAAVTLANVFFVSRDALMAQPVIHDALESMGLVEAAPADQYRNLDLLHLASSEMLSHPTLDETLILNATIVNRDDQVQAFPFLQITLFDAQNQPLAQRVFRPDEYLQGSFGAGDGMAPGAYLPVIMELLDPGQHAVGFELRFL